MTPQADDHDVRRDQDHPDTGPHDQDAERSLLDEVGSGRFVVDDLEIDVGAWLVEQGGREVHVSPNEFRLLACLAQQLGQVVMFDALAAAIWSDRAALYGHEAIINIVSRLRRRLDDRAGEQRYIVAVPGVGYRLRAAPVRGRADADSEVGGRRA